MRSSSTSVVRNARSTAAARRRDPQRKILRGARQSRSPISQAGRMGSRSRSTNAFRWAEDSGGGSADAAAVLRALNALAPRPLDAAALAAIAFRLGADVPYLMSEMPLAFATGRGEQLTALTPLPVRRVVLVALSYGVSSADAFGWYAAGTPATRAAPVMPSALTWDAVAAMASERPRAPGIRAPSRSRSTAPSDRELRRVDRADDRLGIDGVRRVRDTQRGTRFSFETAVGSVGAHSGDPYRRNGQWS